LGRKTRLQNRRPGQVTPRNPAVFAACVIGSNEPPPIFRRAQQRREAGRRVEARQAEPVDRAVAPDQSRRGQIADQAVIADRLGPAAIQFSYLSQSQLLAFVQ